MPGPRARACHLRVRKKALKENSPRRNREEGTADGHSYSEERVLVVLNQLY